jgi:hypothetical protein
MRGLYAAPAYSDVMAFYEFGDFRFFNDGLVGAQTEKFRIGQNGLVRVYGSFSRGAPVTKTTDFTVAAGDNWIICNKGSLMIVNLPAAGNFVGREIHFKNLTTNAVVSASANVIPLAGGAATNQILPAGPGEWCTLVCDAASWYIMQAG